MRAALAATLGPVLDALARDALLVGRGQTEEKTPHPRRSAATSPRKAGAR